MTEIKVIVCSCCNHAILPGEKAVRFPCPNCGETIIWRCRKCRIFAVPYVCSKCKFRGP